MCVHLDGLNREHKFRVWDIILGRTSLHFHFNGNTVFVNTTVCQLCMGACFGVATPHRPMPPLCHPKKKKLDPPLTRKYIVKPEQYTGSWSSYDCDYVHQQRRCELQASDYEEVVENRALLSSIIKRDAVIGFKVTLVTY